MKCDLTKNKIYELIGQSPEVRLSPVSKDSELSMTKNTWICAKITSKQLSVFAFCLTIFLMLFIGHTQSAQAEVGIATWYTVESTKAEGNTGIMANGKPLDESAITCSHPYLKLGTKIQVTNLENKKVIDCEVTDRGPSMNLYRKEAKILDLPPSAFTALGGGYGVTKSGIPYGRLHVKVTVKP